MNFITYHKSQIDTFIFYYEDFPFIEAITICQFSVNIFSSKGRKIEIALNFLSL